MVVGIAWFCLISSIFLSVGETTTVTLADAWWALLQLFAIIFMGLATVAIFANE